MKPQKSPTKDAMESPHPSPQRVEHDITGYSRNGGGLSTVPGSSADKPRAVQPSETPKPGRQESSDNLKSFKVSLEDPTWKVLPAALKKYRINNDNWQSYAMFICYGPSGEPLSPMNSCAIINILRPGNRIERCLSYDEKPLLLFQKLKDAKKNPVFMLKHIKDIRSPIAVAQQKHAARKASSVISQETTVTSATHGHQKQPSTSRTIHRPPKLEVQDLSASTPTLSTGLSPQPGWPDGSILSPAGEGSRSEETNVAPGSAVSHISTSTTYSAMSGSTLVTQNSSASRDSSATKVNGGGNTEPTNGGVSVREMPPASSNGVSYAVAIYPYMAEQDDEFDVVVWVSDI